MIHTAELLKVFQQYRGEAIVIPGTRRPSLGECQH